MSAVDTMLAHEVERLTEQNRLYKERNIHQAKLLAETLDILEKFNTEVKDNLRHFQTCRGKRGYDWKLLLEKG